MSFNVNTLIAARGKQGLMAGCAVGSMLAMAAPAAAQNVISNNVYSTINLTNFTSGAPVEIEAGVMIAPAFGAGVIAGVGSFWSLSNAGEVNAPNGVGVRLDVAGEVTNEGTGVIAGVDGIDLNAGGAVGNGGTISGQGYGVKVGGASGSLVNSGLIAGGYDGISLNHGGDVSNAADGTISGGHIGLYVGNGFGSVANAGLILAREGDAVSLYAGGVFSNAASGRVAGGYTGVFAGGNAAAVMNAGMISGPEFGVYLNGQSEVSNTGTIIGGLDGVIDTGAGGVAMNSGVITGRIGVKMAADAQVVNSGTITGAVDGIKLGDDAKLDNQAGGLIEGGQVGLTVGTNAVVRNDGVILDDAVAGVELGRGGSLVNTGTIGGVAGLVVNGGGVNIFDTGLIESSVAGGNAISLSGGADDLVFGTGAVVVGNVNGGGTGSQVTLQGAGALSNDLLDFGTGSGVEVASGADWVASGDWDVAAVNNDGTLTPGAVGSPLEIGGDFTQAPTGTMRVLVSPSGTSELDVAGNVSLAGTVYYVLAPGAYEPASDTFLVAGGTVNGGFASVASSAPAPGEEPPAAAHQAPSVVEVAAVQATPVDAVPAGAPAQTAPMAAVATPPVAAQPVAQVTQPAVEVAQSAQRVALVVTRPLVVAPADDALFAQANQAATLDGLRVDDELLGHATGGAAPCAGALPGASGLASVVASGFCQAGGWIEATGTQADVDHAFGANTAGFMAGIDRAVTAGGARIGMAVGYDETSLEDKAGGKAALDTTRVGLYGSWPVGAVVLSGGILDGFVGGSTKRATGAGNAIGKANGNVFAAAAQAAMPFVLGRVSLLPAAGLDVASVNMSGFGERTGASTFAVTVASSAGTSVQPYLRLGVSEAFVTASQIVITPAASVGVSYRTDGAHAVDVKAPDGSRFEGVSRGSNGTAGLAMVGISTGRGNWALTAKYTAQMAGDWQEESLEGELEVRF